VATAPEVESLGIPSFRYPGSVNRSPCKIQKGQSSEVREGHSFVQIFQAIEDEPMDDGEEGGQAQQSIHVEASAAVTWLTELRTECKNGRRNGDARGLEAALSARCPSHAGGLTDQRPIQVLQGGIAVKRKVRHLDCRAPDHEHTAKMIQLVAKSEHFAGVVGEGM
jgi:hypothetical protein